ncbi:HORMA domain-containing protein 1 [Liparis tanakae]|uniref:HORMA domain-containing protein 1 n=1 Tax=Liparis tanakae TaxID=230148 RepID=A0A4Z2FL05_9TELE|nr:HORMA domain-containing protein 1 [Liparis tanakae]
MAATDQQVRSSAETQLLPNQVLSEQQSLVVMKKLLAIAVSGITYLRGIFPEKAYGSKNVADQKVMILREEHSCPGAIQVVQWMQGCFEAIQKKYIYTDPEHPEKVTECYQFTIHYTAEGAQMEFESKNDNQVSSMSCGNTKKASTLLVRKLYTLMQNLGPLPDNVCLNMKLAYYENVTPHDYQPPGFMEADGDTMEFEKEPVKLTMGEVVTPFHTLKMDMTTERRRLEEVTVEERVQGPEKWVLHMEEDGVLSQAHVIEDVERPDNEDLDLDNTEIQMSCYETIESCEKAIEMDTEVKKSPIAENLRRTRSGRVIRSTTVSRYEIPTSQETPSTSAPEKRRKFSEPKERF